LDQLVASTTISTNRSVYQLEYVTMTPVQDWLVKHAASALGQLPLQQTDWWH